MTIREGHLTIPAKPATGLYKKTKPVEYGPDKSTQTPGDEAKEEPATRDTSERRRGGLDGIKLGARETILG